MLKKVTFNLILMKSAFWLTIALILASFMLSPAIVSGQITYSNIDLQINPNHVSVCPCVPITPEYVTITVRNLGAESVIPSFELLDIPSGWTGQIQNYLDTSLAPGEEGMVSLLLISPPNCNVAPGTYSLTVRATGLTASDVVEKELEIEIMQCYGVELSVSDTHQETCSGSEQAVIYPLTIKNLGKSDDVVELSADVPWASFSEASFTIGPGASETIDLMLEPPEGLSGLHSVSVTASSETNPKTQDTKEVTVQINDCFSFNAFIQPSENTVCLGQSMPYRLLINNTGMLEDTYVIYAPDWLSVSKNEVSVPAGESMHITITASPVQAGSMPLEVTVVSSADPDKQTIVSALVNANECRDVSVVLSPSGATACRGMDAEITATIKNTGTLEGTFELQSSTGSLDLESVSLEPGEEHELMLTVETSNLTEGEHSISVTASEGAISDTGKITLTVEDCYAAEIEIVPAEQQSCVCDVSKFNMIIKNSGEMADAYHVSFSSDIYEHETDIELAPGESKSIPVSIPTLGVDPGEYSLKASAESEHVSVADTATLNITAYDVCYSMLMVTEDETVLVQECTAKAIPITIKNTGIRTERFQISYEGPEWIYVSPVSVELEPNEQAEAYLYVSPPYEVTGGNFSAIVSAVSQHSRSSMNISIDIVQAGDIQNVTTGEGDEDDEGPEITLNVSTGTGSNITGLVTADDESPVWKTVVVAIITIIIVIILVIRFALLVRK